MAMRALDALPLPFSQSGRLSFVAACNGEKILIISREERFYIARSRIHESHAQVVRRNDGVDDGDVADK